MKNNKAIPFFILITFLGTFCPSLALADSIQSMQLATQQMEKDEFKRTPVFNEQGNYQEDFPFELKLVKTEDVIPTEQPVGDTKLIQMAEYYNKRDATLFGPIIATERNGEIIILDGNHRYFTMKDKLKLPYVPVLIIPWERFEIEPMHRSFSFKKVSEGDQSKITNHLVENNYLYKRKPTNQFSHFASVYFLNEEYYIAANSDVELYKKTNDLHDELEKLAKDKDYPIDFETPYKSQAEFDLLKSSSMNMLIDLPAIDKDKDLWRTVEQSIRDGEDVLFPRKIDRVVIPGYGRIAFPIKIRYLIDLKKNIENSLDQKQVDSHLEAAKREIDAGMKELYIYTREHVIDFAMVDNFPEEETQKKKNYVEHASTMPIPWNNDAMNNFFAFGRMDDYSLKVQRTEPDLDLKSIEKNVQEYYTSNFTSFEIFENQPFLKAS